MSNKKFLPKTGLLIARCQISLASTMIEVQYRDNSRDELHYKTICRIDNFSAKPYYSECVDTMTAAAQVNICNDSVLHRHFLTWSELGKIKALWDSKEVSFSEWLKEVLELPDLDETEKNRFRRAYPEETTKP